MKKTTLAFAAAILSSSAFAGDFAFSYENEELLSDTGMANLVDRLESEARSYCSDEYRSVRDLAGKADCLNEIITAAIDKIDNRELVAFVDGKKPNVG